MRKYSDAHGRFMQTDPLWELEPQFNPYHYCRHSPVVTKDPTGETPFVIPIVVEALAEGLAATGILVGMTMYGGCETVELSSNATYADEKGSSVIQVDKTRVPVASPKLQSNNINLATILKNNNQASTIQLGGGIEIKVHDAGDVPGSNDEHAPGHIHIGSKGSSDAEKTRIGSNGHPIKGNRELTAKERRAVQKNKPLIRKKVKKQIKNNKRRDDDKNKKNKDSNIKPA